MIRNAIDAPDLYPFTVTANQGGNQQISVVGYDEAKGRFLIEANGTPFADLPLQVMFDTTPIPQNIRTGYVTLNGIKINRDR